MIATDASGEGSRKYGKTGSIYKSWKWCCWTVPCIALSQTRDFDEKGRVGKIIGSYARLQRPAATRSRARFRRSSVT